MPANRLSKLLEDIRLLDQDRFELVQSLREMILDLAPSISEEVKYGGILFSAKESFCGVFSYAKHVSLEFGAGASLPEKFKVLEGEGKLRRHIKLSSAHDISGKHVREYLLLALNASGKPWTQPTAPGDAPLSLHVSQQGASRDVILDRIQRTCMDRRPSGRSRRLRSRGGGLC